MMRIRPAVPSDEPAIRSLLEAGGLRTRDLVPASTQGFLVAVDGPALVGTVAVESAGHEGLLRSLAVDARAHRRGLGSQLVTAAETQARGQGITHLYLLTDTASRFFERLGYRPIPRDSAPPFVRGTEQFRGLCPASSTLMEKSL